VFDGVLSLYHNTAAGCSLISYSLRVFEYKMLSGTFRTNSGEAMGRWRQLHIEELHILYFSLDIVRVIKSKGLG
jgi:hypothetical protein